MEEQATDKQVRFLLDLFMKDGGFAPHTPVDASMARRYRLPQAETLRDAVKSLSKPRASALIDWLKGDD
ncbi:MAG TPA: hypothetical protein VFI71_12405 [Pyrinomonadaceae bacterium]|nr:hypothetical protein [Pyrinomonadaceae bacterium]